MRFGHHAGSAPTFRHRGGGATLGPVGPGGGVPGPQAVGQVDQPAQQDDAKKADNSAYDPPNHLLDPRLKNQKQRRVDKDRINKANSIRSLSPILGNKVVEALFCVVLPAVATYTRESFMKFISADGAG